MSYIKCVACPCRVQCDEEGQCVNTWVTAQPRGASVRGTHIATGDGSNSTFEFPNLNEQFGKFCAPTSAVDTATVVKVLQQRVAAKPDTAGRPAAGTTTGRVWGMADQVFAERGNIDKDFRKEVVRRCEAAGINKSTASVQFGRWISSKS